METTFFIIASFAVPVKQWKIHCSEALRWRRTDLQTFRCFSYSLLLKFWRPPHTKTKCQGLIPSPLRLSTIIIIIIIMFRCAETPAAPTPLHFGEFHTDGWAAGVAPLKASRHYTNSASPLFLTSRKCHLNGQNRILYMLFWWYLTVLGDKYDQSCSSHRFTA